MNTLSRPPLIVASHDFARIEQLLDAPALRQSLAAQALWAELDRAEVREPRNIPPDVVTMRSEVVCRDEASGVEHRLRLSYPHEQGDGYVSVLAPAGSALLGLRVGDAIDWPIASGATLRLRVLRIVHQPEAAGDFQS